MENIIGKSMREFKIGDKFKDIENDLTYEVSGVVRFGGIRSDVAHYELVCARHKTPILAYYSDETFLDGTFNLFNSDVWEYVDDGNFWEVE